MRWRGGRRSGNIEDRRGGSGGGPGRRLRLPGGLGGGPGGSLGGGRIRLPRGARRGGIGGLGAVILLLIAVFVFGLDPAFLLGGGSPAPSQSRSTPRPEAENELADFVSVVLADTEDTWQALFQAEGRRYEEPRLVLFTDSVRSACGLAGAAVGPFYCPGDSKIYIDLGFYRELRERFAAPGDFAQAYVVAHEVGHHVQNLLGISHRVQQARRQLGEADANALSVRLELQADCLAGVWAHHADQERQILEVGDVEEALNAASAIGDDRLQRRAGGTVVPESFTHGSSAQRMRWFRRGLEEGSLQGCDSFAKETL